MGTAAARPGVAICGANFSDAVITVISFIGLTFAETYIRVVAVRIISGWSSMGRDGWSDAHRRASAV